MKTLKLQFRISLLLLLGVYWNSSFGQWTEIPIPVNNSLHAVDIHSSGVCYAGGIDLMKSSDFGDTWTEIVFTGPTAPFYNGVLINSVYVKNDTTVYCAGQSTTDLKSVIIRSTDGGVNWETVFLGTMNWQEFYHIDFYDDNNGLAVGNFNMIYRTIDGGDSWFLSSTGATGVFYDFCYLDQDSIWIVGAQARYLSINGGVSWNQIAETGKFFQSVKYDNGTQTLSAIYRETTESYLYTSTDGGANWTSEFVSNGVINNHEFVSPDTVHYAHEDYLYVSFGGANYLYGFPITAKNTEDIEFDFGVGLAVTSIDVNNDPHLFKYDYANPQYQQIVDFSVPDTICQNQAGNYIPTNDMLDTYEWLENGSSVSNSMNLNHAFANAGSNTLSLVTSFGGYLDTVHQNIFVTAAPVIATPFTLNPDTIICEGTTYGFWVYDIAGSDGYAVYQNGSEISFTSSSGNDRWYSFVGFQFADSDVDVVKWETNMCDSIAQTFSFTVHVEQFADVNQNFYAANGFVCSGDSTNIVIPNPEPNYTFTVFGNGSVLTSQTANSAGDTLFINTGPLTNDVEITIEGSTPGDSCLSTLVASDSIYIDASSAQFDLIEPYFYTDSIIPFDTTNVFGNNFDWSTTGNPSVFSDTLLKLPQIEFDTAGFYDIELVSYGAVLGCADTHLATIGIFAHPPQTSSQSVCFLNSNDTLPVILDKHVDIFGNIIVVGYRVDLAYYGYPGPMFEYSIQKYDSDGNLLWEVDQEIQGFLNHKSGMMGCVSTDAQGNIFVGGVFEAEIFKYKDSTLFQQISGPMPRKTFLFKLDPNGDLIWSLIPDSETVHGGIGDVLVDHNTSRLFISVPYANGVWNFNSGQEAIPLLGLHITMMDLDGNYINDFYAQTIHGALVSLMMPFPSSYESRSTPVGPELHMGSDSILYVMGELTELQIDFGAHTIFPGAGQHKAFIAKLDPYSSNPGWIDAKATAEFYHFQHSDQIPVMGHHMDENNNLYQSINWQPSINEVIIDQDTINADYGSAIFKYDSGLNHQWHSIYEPAFIKDIFTTNGDLIYFTGHYMDQFSEFINGIPNYMISDSTQNNMFIGTLDMNGHINWMNTIGNSNYQYGDVIAGNYCGDVILSAGSKDINNYLGVYTDLEVSLSGTNYGTHHGTFLLKMSDSCIAGGCGTLCNNPLYLPNPIISYNDSTVNVQQFETYQWYYGGQAITGADTSVYFYNQNGVYSIDVTDANGCSASAILGDSCLNQSYFVTSSIGFNDTMLFVPEYYVHQWILGGTPISGANDSIYLYTSNGSYSVELTDLNGCMDTVMLDTMCLNMSYFVTPSITQNDTILSTGIYDNYQWYFNSGILNDDTLQQYIYSQSGDYYVFVTDNFGCSGNSDTISVIYDVGLDDLESLNGVVVYPNPSDGIFNLRFLKETAESIEIYDASGKLLHQRENTSGQKIMTFDLDLESGAYTIVLRFENSEFQRLKVLVH